MSVTELQTGKQGQQKPLARVSVTSLRGMKARGEKIVMLTAYDYSTAKLADTAGIHCYWWATLSARSCSATTPSACDHGRHDPPHQSGDTRCVPCAGRGRYALHELHDQRKEALHNAARFMQEGGAQAVKLEGAAVAPTIRRMVARHTGDGPPGPHAPIDQCVRRPQNTGKTREAAGKLLDDALGPRTAGSFALVLETVPTPLAALIAAS